MHNLGQSVIKSVLDVGFIKSVHPTEFRGLVIAS